MLVDLLSCICMIGIVAIALVVLLGGDDDDHHHPGGNMVTP